MSRIPVSGPSITDREIAYVTDAVRNAWYGDADMYHRRFEETFAAYVGRRYAVALPSCTSAIHLSLLALGVGPGDEVIVPELTWIASAAPVDYVGATPVFADVDRRTWCLSASAVEALTTARTKAVIPVDLYGGLPDLPEIERVAARSGIAVIEDAAQAIGSRMDHRPAGNFGIASVFSFHGSKTLTTGEGGMLVTDDRALYDRVLVLRDHGRVPGDVTFVNREVAYKYKMSALQAALGLAQIERVEELVEQKRAIFNWYRQRLSAEPGLTLNVEPPGVRNTYWMVTVIIDRDCGIEKQTLIDRLKAREIDARPFFYPLSSLPAYAGRPEALRAAERNRVAYDVSPTGVNLPSGLNMTERLVEVVCNVLVEEVRACREAIAR